MTLQRLAWILCGLMLLLAPAAGCSRTRYRIQADQDVTNLVDEKSNDPRWALSNFNLRIDPRSRYFDPYNPDREPMPPDDPNSNAFMRYVDGKRAYRRWFQNGVQPDIQNPGWREMVGQYAPITEAGEVKLDLDGSVGLALIHSPDWRVQLETIYLSSLDVSTERFRFVTQFFGGFGPNFTHIGPLLSPTGKESNTLTVGTNPTPTASGVNVGTTPRALQFQRQFATGGQLITTFANSFVWQFAGGESNATASLLGFNLVQPLLRAGGRAVALETLTISERTLLANLRALQRYRQGFYTNIAVGDFNVTGPQRKGGFTGGTGLTGFTGQGAGGLGGVGGATNFGRAGFGAATNVGGAAGGAAGFAGGGAGTIGGFVGLLQQLQQIRNTQDSLSLQLQTLALLEANLEAGVIDITQVDVFRQNIETERANLLQSQIGLENAMDTFKRQILGLPPDLPMELDDTMIRQFRLIDPRTKEAERQITAFIEKLGKTKETPSLEELNQAFEEFAALRPKVAQGFVEIQTDLKNLTEATEARQKLMTVEERPLFAAEQKRLLEGLADLKERFEASAGDLDRLRASLTPDNSAKTTNSLVALATALSTLTQELSLVQARARLETIVVEPIELDSAHALAIARANRMDWMNNRATLVDTWRLITFNANALKSNLTVTFSGDLGTKGNNPLAFNGANGDLSAGLRFDPPFTRLLERNNYRQALINYQQDRRTLIQFEDSVNQTLRQDLRVLKQLRANLEIQRRDVAIAVRRVDKTLEDLNQPPAPVAPGEQSAQLGPTAALNLLTAISDLRNAQNNFMSVWLNYYSERMQLVRDLGIMQIDEHGLWIDVPLDAALANLGDQCPLPPAIPDEWLKDAGFDPGPSARDAETLPLGPKAVSPDKESEGSQPERLFQLPEPKPPAKLDLNPQSKKPLRLLREVSHEATPIQPHKPPTLLRLKLTNARDQ